MVEFCPRWNAAPIPILEMLEPATGPPLSLICEHRSQADTIRAWAHLIVVRDGSNFSISMAFHVLFRLPL